jgi:signal transduction histidine kinase
VVSDGHIPQCFAVLAGGGGRAWTAAHLRIAALLRYRQSSDQLANWRLWRWVVIGMSSGYGLLWTAAILLFLDPGEPISLILLVIIPIGLTSGAAATGAAIPASFFSFSLIVVGALVVALVASGGPLAESLAGLAIVNLLLNISICFNIHQGLDQALRLRLENEAMRREAENKGHVLRAALAEAERASGAKTRFLAAASHDLRQPIHALGLAFSALAGRIQRPENKTLVQRIEETIEIIGEMLDALLNVSKLDSGVVRPVEGAVCVQHLFQRLEEAFCAEARQRGIRLRFRPSAAWVRSDPAMLEQILRNLVGNALRYTERGGVLVAGRRRGQGLRLDVWDTGCGIQPEKIASCFAEFHQLHNPQRDRAQGLGLGLAIVQRLARLLDRPLKVCSRPGRGSLFSIEVPRLQDDQIRSIQNVNEIGQTAYQEQLPLRILVLDDERIVRQAMQDRLVGWGYLAISTASLDEALAVAGEAAAGPVDRRLPTVRRIDRRRCDRGITSTGGLSYPRPAGHRRHRAGRASANQRTWLSGAAQSRATRQAARYHPGIGRRKRQPWILRAYPMVAVPLRNSPAAEQRMPVHFLPYDRAPAQ